MNFQFPAFLHNLFHWGFVHDEGVAKGTVDEAKVEANPIIQFAVSAAEAAGKAVLLDHVSKVMGIEPTMQGVAGALGGIIENSTAVPVQAKEPLKLLLGGFLSGADFLAAPVPPVPQKQADAVTVEQTASSDQSQAALSDPAQGATQ